MNQPRHLNLLACQIAIPSMTTANERIHHLQRCEHATQTQLDLNGTVSVDVVVMPELSSIDYSRSAFKNLEVLAEPDKGESFRCWSQFAQRNGCWVVYGFARCIDNGYRISTAVVSPGGELAGVYDKLHLAQFGDSMEKEYFTATGQELLIFTVKGFRIAPIICYDIRIPELCRTLVVKHKVDLITHVGAYARDDSFATWHAFATTRAVENQCYFLSLNRAGQHYGSSLFCPPWIDSNSPATTFDAHDEDFKTMTLDRYQIETARREYTFLEDRLPDYDLPIVES